MKTKPTVGKRGKKYKYIRKEKIKAKPDWFKGIDFKVEVNLSTFPFCECEMCMDYRKQYQEELASLTDKKE